MKKRIALTIAGSDSGGGAGIQADIKTMTVNGVFAASAVTALTAQNTTGVTGIMDSTPEFLAAQIDAVFTDLRPDAVKIGMVSSAALIETIADRLTEYGADHVVVDPVMVATSGARLISEEAVGTLKERLLPLAEVITPNIPEAEVLSDMEIHTPDDMTKAAELIGEKYGCAVWDHRPEREYDIIVDAIFGIGLKRPLEGIFAEAVAYVNGSGAFVLSVDIPSGVGADTGRILGCAVRADVTVTFAFLKRGLLLYPGASCAGRVRLAQIGITEESFQGKLPAAFTFRRNAPLPLPERDPNGNKGTFGKVLLAAGSPGMAGAAVLSARAVLGAGAGMVRVLCGEENRSILQAAAPEAMLALYGEAAGPDGAGYGRTPSDAFRDARGWADVVAAGCGLGRSREAQELIRLILTETEKPLVLDADGINILAADRALLDHVCRMREAGGAPLILTPHPGELGRLAQTDMETLLSDPVSVCTEWAGRLNAVVLCKTAATAAADPQGRVYINHSGNSGMATAGSGDVLTGIIAGLLAQGMEPFEAACLGVYLHGLAGDAAAARAGEYAVTAGRLLEALGPVMKEAEEAPPAGRSAASGRGYGR